MSWFSAMKSLELEPEAPWREASVQPCVPPEVCNKFHNIRGCSWCITRNGQGNYNFEAAFIRKRKRTPDVKVMSVCDLVSAPVQMDKFPSKSGRDISNFSLIVRLV
jgi:hypothetical protein